MEINADALKRAKDLFTVSYFDDEGCSGARGTLKNFYALDYRASRVNFNLHQKRAHELAHLVDRTHGLEKSTLRVAICGGGIGGLTCFLTLHALGFKKTEIYEGGQRLLGLHLGCKHRHSHPSYNDWPEALRHCATTDHPLMNWSAGTVHEIAEDMLADELVESATREKEHLIHCEYPITSLAKVKRGEEDLWEITGTHGQNRYADVVIYALGFGREQFLEGSRADSYWWDDNLENFQRELYRFDRHKLIVCGLGDGGLIDTIRIGYGPERHDMVGPGLIAAGRNAKYHEPPREPDFSVAEDDRSDWEERIVNACTRHRAIGDLLLSELAFLVKEASENDPVLGAKLQALKTQQNASQGNSVYLVGDREFGISQNMSPINVVLFALLLTELDQATGNPDKKARYLLGKYDKDAGMIRLHEGDAAEFGDLATSDHVVFLRVGPKDDLMDIVKPLEGKFRAERPDKYNFQTTLEKNDASRRYDLLKGLGQLRDGDEALDPETIEWDYRMACIQRYVERHLGEQAQVSLQRCPQNGFWVEIAAPIASSTDTRGEVAMRNREAILAQGGFDRRLFGAPIAFTTPEAERPRFSATARKSQSQEIGL